MRSHNDIYIYRSIWPVMYNLHKIHLSGRNVGKLSTITVNHDVRVALNSCGFSIKNDSWKSGVIYVFHANLRCWCIVSK